ncbi:hypothetical protein L3Q82_019200 [Scortum barcoo]|uniref:Uncharacterized protein n=1 Tax=Scortum barcoo TaxID=214431 RepID=A0ACB8VIK6_9TELE|nr:hypothetical protein L3Q82_019200 [Scortum barcoo]
MLQGDHHCLDPELPDGQTPGCVDGQHPILHPDSEHQRSPGLCVQSSAVLPCSRMTAWPPTASDTIIKFADDTTIIFLITGDDETDLQRGGAMCTNTVQQTEEEWHLIENAVLHREIYPASLVIVALTWVETTVRQAQRQQPDPGLGPLRCLIVPDAAHSQVLQWSHSSKLARHPGINQTLTLIRHHFWWPSMDRDTREFVRACTICAKGKSTHMPSAGLLRPLPVPGQPWSHMALDFITALPPAYYYYYHHHYSHHHRPLL